MKLLYLCTAIFILIAGLFYRITYLSTRNTCNYTALLTAVILSFISFPVFCEKPVAPDLKKTLILDLEKAVYTGLKNNRELLFKGKENRLAEKNLKLKYRDYFPDVKLSYSDAASVAYYNPDSHIKKLNLSLTQNIYDKGRRKSAIDLGKKQLVLEKIKTNDSKEDFTFQIISSFKDILKLCMEISILNNTYLITSGQLKIGKKEKELGGITILNYLEMEIAHKNIELVLKKKNNEKERKMFSFSRLLSLEPDIKLELTGAVNTEYNGFIIPNSDFFILTAAEKSSLFKEKFLERESAYQNYKITLKKNIPDMKTDCGFSMSGEDFPLTEPGFDISVTLSFNKPGLPSSFTAGINKEDNNRSRTINAESRPFSNLENIYTKDSAKLTLEKTVWGINEFRINNEFNIREILFEIDSLKKELILLRKKLKVQNKKTEIEKLQLKLGEIKRLDYMESTIELSKERINLINTIASLYQKEISLLRLCGIKNMIETSKNLIIQKDTR